MKKKCIIITSFLDTKIKDNIQIYPEDFIICADGGFKHACAERLVPDIVIGDFDSFSYSEALDIKKRTVGMKKTQFIKTKAEKDDTDTVMCVRHGMEKGYRNFLIVGGLGGRIDHTFANIQVLSYLLDNDSKGWVIDGNNRITMLDGPETIELEKNGHKYFSIYSYTEKCKGVCEKNSKYTLDNVTLSQSNPLGTSNEFLDKTATISVDKGKLLVTLSNE